MAGYSINETLRRFLVSFEDCNSVATICHDLYGSYHDARILPLVNDAYRMGFVWVPDMPEPTDAERGDFVATTKSGTLSFTLTDAGRAAVGLPPLTPVVIATPPQKKITLKAKRLAMSGNLFGDDDF